MSDVPPPIVELTPYRVDGFANVNSVRFDADGLTIVIRDQSIFYSYASIADWPRPAWFWRLLWKLGWRRKFLPVGERSWSPNPENARIRFFTEPALTIWMPTDGHLPYGSSRWRQIENRLNASGFATWDMN